MLFFCMDGKKQHNTLQVRIPIRSFQKSPEGRKRVSPSVSGSLTLEAALVLPLFLFACVTLLMPFRILDVERQMQAVAERTAEAISQMAYVGRGEALSSAAAYAYAEGAVRRGAAKLPAEGISLAGSKLLTDGKQVTLVINYELQLPFSVLGLGRVNRTNRAFRRAWIGKEGSGEKGGQVGEDEKDTLVYVGQGSTRYHRDAHCHYLSNRLRKVDRKQLDSLRNESGGIYKACSRCGGEGENVYILPSGEHYHSSGACSAIQAYVREVALHEVAHLGPCSYCSGG